MQGKATRKGPRPSFHGCLALPSCSSSHAHAVLLYACALLLQEVKVFAGHEAGVLHAISNPYGNLLVSGGRDSAIKFWDVMSGVCVKTLR